LKQLFLEIFCLRTKFALFNFVNRNLKLKYRKSVLGVLWTILIPAATAVVYYFVFQYVMNVKIPNYLIFILMGVVPWTFFQGAVSSGLESVVSNHSILNKVPINLAIFPMSEAITHFINMILATPVIVITGMIFAVPFTMSLLQIIPLLFFLFVLAYSIGIISSILFVYLRDLRPIMSVLLQIWFYLTPVIYNEEMIPSRFGFIKILNPLFYIFSGFHKSIQGALLAPAEFATICLWTLFTFLVAAFIYSKNRRFLIERL
jgi:ABC-2 type transport system permease protein